MSKANDKEIEKLRKRLDLIEAARHKLVEEADVYRKRLADALAAKDTACELLDEHAANHGGTDADFERIRILRATGKR